MVVALVRSYAVTMALIAMLVLFARGLRHGSGFEGTVPQCIGWAAVFAVVGAVVGAVAQSTVDESVRSQFESEVGQMNEAS